jgi:hypothetical protein
MTYTKQATITHAQHNIHAHRRPRRRRRLTAAARHEGQTCNKIKYRRWRACTIRRTRAQQRPPPPPAGGAAPVSPSLVPAQPAFVILLHLMARTMITMMELMVVVMVLVVVVVMVLVVVVHVLSMISPAATLPCKRAKVLKNPLETFHKRL